MTWVTFICMLVHWYDSAPATVNFITNIKLRYIVGNIIRAGWTELNLNNVFKMQIFLLLQNTPKLISHGPEVLASEHESSLKEVPWFKVLLLRLAIAPRRDLEDDAVLSKCS